MRVVGSRILDSVGVVWNSNIESCLHLSTLAVLKWCTKTLCFHAQLVKLLFTDCGHISVNEMFTSLTLPSFVALLFRSSPEVCVQNLKDLLDGFLTFVPFQLLGQYNLFVPSVSNWFVKFDQWKLVYFVPY